MLLLTVAGNFEELLTDKPRPDSDCPMHLPDAPAPAEPWSRPPAALPAPYPPSDIPPLVPPSSETGLENARDWDWDWGGSLKSPVVSRVMRASFNAWMALQ